MQILHKGNKHPGQSSIGYLPRVHMHFWLYDFHSIHMNLLRAIVTDLKNIQVAVYWENAELHNHVELMIRVPSLQHW